MANKPIKESLGLGEVMQFSDGTQLPCVPACLSDLEDSMDLYIKSLGTMSLQAIYAPQNKEAKEAFEELLFIATGRKIPKEDLRKKIRVGDEVVQFIDRFLGFKPRNARTEEAQPE